MHGDDKNTSDMTKILHLLFFALVVNGKITREFGHRQNLSQI